MSIDENLGTYIDALYELRQKRLEVSKEVDKLKAMETEMREKILTVLDETGLAKASGMLATAGIRTSSEPVIQDWEQIHSWIRINNRFDLLQKRLSAPAWRELLEDGQLIPGTECGIARDLSLTKSTR